VSNTDWQTVRGLRHHITATTRTADGVVVRTACGQTIDVQIEDARTTHTRCLACASALTPTPVGVE
jgi:hypothetical protein